MVIVEHVDPVAGLHCSYTSTLGLRLVKIMFYAEFIFCSLGLAGLVKRRHGGDEVCLEGVDMGLCHRGGFF